MVITKNSSPPIVMEISHHTQITASQPVVKPGETNGEMFYEVLGSMEIQFFCLPICLECRIQTV